MNISWKKDENGLWQLQCGDTTVHYITPKQREDLEKVFEQTIGYESDFEANNTFE